jgi:hypothetical protein
MSSTTPRLGTLSTYLYAVSFYDEKARLIQLQSQNITSGTYTDKDGNKKFVTEIHVSELLILGRQK